MTDFDVAVLGGGPAGYVAAIRSAQLGDDRSIREMRHAMNDGLRVNDHIDLFGRNVEKIGCFDELQRLVHQGGTVDGVLDTHGPVRVGGGGFRTGHAHLVHGRGPERAARGRDSQPFKRPAVSQALMDRAML